MTSKKDSEKDLYKTLRVNKNASADEIKEAYRKLLKYHPDKNPEGGAMFAEINDAYGILSNPRTRNIYDLAGYSAASRARAKLDEAVEDVHGGAYGFGQGPRGSGFGQGGFWANVLKELIGKAEGAANDVINSGFVFGEEKQPTEGWTGAIANYLKSPRSKIPLFAQNDGDYGAGGGVAGSAYKFFNASLGRMRNFFQPVYHIAKWVTDLPLFKKIVSSEGSGAIKYVVGPTGSGKTIGTLVASVVANSGKEMRALVIVPTRVVAHRLYSVLAGIFGQSNPEMFGVVTKDKFVLSPKTVNLICTPGIASLLVRQNSVELTFTHIFMDEVHIRTLEINFILFMFRNYFETTNEKRMKFYFMTASSDSMDKIRGFFDEVEFARKSAVRIEAHEEERIYPVYKTSYADVKHWSEDFKRGATNDLNGDCIRSFEDKEFKDPVCYDWRGELLITESSVKYQCEQLLLYILSGNMGGDVLVFVPGLRVMRDLRAYLLAKSNFPNRNFEVFQIHGQLDMDPDIFKQSMRRKVILSTNIAETSLTFPGLMFVVDSLCENRRARFKPGGLIKKPMKAIGKDSLEQRAGRVGRTHPGLVFYIGDYSDYDRIMSQTTPSRADEEEPVAHMLLLSKCEYSFDSVLSYVDPMVEDVYNSGLAVLESGGFIKKVMDEYQVTEYGQLASELIGIEPDLAVTILMGTVFGCQSAMVQVCGALMNEIALPIHRRDPEFNSLYHNHALGSLSKSEHTTIWAAFKYAEETENELNQIQLGYGANSPEYRNLKSQYGDLINVKAVAGTKEHMKRINQVLSRCGLLDKNDISPNNSNRMAQKICFVSGLGQNCCVFVAKDTTPWKDWAFKTLDGSESIKPESCWTANNCSIGDIGVYHRIETRSDNKNIGPVTAVGRFFFACFGAITMNVEEKDGAIVFKFLMPNPTELKIKLDARLIKVALKIRGFLQKLLLTVSDSPPVGMVDLRAKILSFAAAAEKVDAKLSGE